MFVEKKVNIRTKILDEKINIKVTVSVEKKISKAQIKSFRNKK